MSASKIVELLFYLTITSVYVYTWIHDTKLFNDGKYNALGFPFDETFGRRAKFLTCINMIVQIGYFILSTINAVKRFFNPKRNRLDSLCDLIYSIIAFPFSSLVVLTFWSIYMIDKKSVFPPGIEDIVPWWQNQVMHTLPLISCLIDNFFVYKTYPKLLYGASTSVAFGSIYLAWVFYIAHISNKWVYGIFEVLNFNGRVLLILFELLVLITAYCAGARLNDFMWKNTLRQKSKKY